MLGTVATSKSSSFENLDELICCCLLNPFRTVIIQLPIHALFYRMMGNPGRFSSVVDCARHIWTNEGLAGFYRELPLYLSFMLVTAI